MFEALSLVFMLADGAGERPTLPRRPDAPVEQEPGPERQGLPADPLFDKPLTATDDPAFVLLAVESTRQAAADARAGKAGLSNPAHRAAAEQIEKQQGQTLARLETLARRKGWRLPEDNPGRTGAVPVSGPVRTSADFIINQIKSHENTLQLFRAQIDGKGDADLRRELREALPGYQKNLEMLLGLKL